MITLKKLKVTFLCANTSTWKYKSLLISCNERDAAAFRKHCFHKSC